MWTGNANIGMAPRELTADDVAASFERRQTRPGWKYPQFDTITATGRYTMVWEWNMYDANWPWELGCGIACAVMAPESVAAGPDDWRNAVGTGAFIMTNYVSGSAVTYERNPDYWGTTTINGKVYQTPFIDKLVYPIIADESTCIAALRTGTIDWWPRVKLVFEDDLSKTCPDLVQLHYLTGRVQYFRVNRLDTPYLSNRDVRRALMVAVDFTAIRDVVYEQGDIYGWPLGRGVPGATLLEDLPAEASVLYSFNPTLARQMIADAGYPNGFSFTIMVGQEPEMRDLATMCAGYWADVGVTANIQVTDPAAKSAADNDRRYDMSGGVFTVINPYVVLSLLKADSTGSTFTMAEGTHDLYMDMLSTVDPVSRTQKIHDLALFMLEDAGWIPFSNPYNLNCYWPWIQNYYGEIDCGYYHATPMLKTLWIDQDLKKALGYK